MASDRADNDRTADRDPFDIREGQESVGGILVEMIRGVQSALTYVGARTVNELHERVEIGVQTAAGYGEGTPHGSIRR